MPGFFTHIISADKALNKATTPEVKTLIENNLHEFYLGAQGPDFFEYDTKGNKYEEAAARMSDFFHGRTVNESICSLMGRILTLEKEEKDAVTAYIFGYLLHYCVDCEIHPYIYYRTGIDIQQVVNPQRFPIYHARLESDIDMLLLEAEGLPSPKEYVPSNRIESSRNSLNAIARMYMYASKEVYGKNVSKERILNAFIQMHNKVDKYCGKPGISLFKNKKDSALEEARCRCVDKLDRSLDQLNLNHRPWNTTWENRRRFTTDVPTMLDNAIKSALEIFDAVYAYLYNDASQISASKIIGDDSMYSGVVWNTPMVHHYFELIYENDALPVISDNI